MPAEAEVCSDVGLRVACVVREAAAAAIADRGAFCIAIAGGSLVQMLGSMAAIEGVEWDKWHVAWVDERCVAHAHPDSNYGAARTAWLAKVPIPSAQVIAIDEATLAASAAGAERAEAAAVDYEQRLRRGMTEGVLPRGKKAGMPLFDLLLLGFGPGKRPPPTTPYHPLPPPSPLPNPPLPDPPPRHPYPTPTPHHGFIPPLPSTPP